MDEGRKRKENETKDTNELMTGWRPCISGLNAS
jgi:hypothetical protein